MHTTTALLADLRQRERTAGRLPHRDTASRRMRRIDGPPSPIQPKDTTAMTTWFIDTDIQLSIAEMKRDEMIRASLLRQHLRDGAPQASIITNLRLTLANVLIALGQAVKPAASAEEWTGAPRTAA